MKFFIPILLMAAAAYAEECSEQILDITKNCLISITEDNYEEGCAKLLEEKCQKFLNDPFSVATSCKADDEDFKSVFNEESMEILRMTANVSCAKDSTGKKCPVSSIYISKKEDYSENLVKESCSSKTCANALNQFIDFTIKTMGSEETLEKMKTDLNADECVKQQKDDTNSSGGAPAGNAPAGDAPTGDKNDDSSDARLAVKIGGTLILSLLLSLIAIF